MSSSVTLGDLFTDKQLRRALDIVTDDPQGLSRIERLRTEIVEPQMEHIDKITGHKNNPGFFAYLLEYSLTRDIR